MSMTHALGRIGELQATLNQFSGAQPPVESYSPASSSTSLASQSGSSSVTTAGLPSRSGDQFEALMRVLNYSPTPAAPTSSSLGATSASSGTSGTSGTSSTSGSSSSSSVAAASGTSKNGADAVELARQYLGVPYVWGGNDPATGLDCSGLVKLVYEQMGVELPRVAVDQAREGREVPSLAEAEPGDLIVTYEGGHIGIYIGDGQMLHAPRPGRDVSIDPVEHYTDGNGIMTIRRLIDSPSEAMAADAAGDRARFESAAGVNS